MKTYELTYIISPEVTSEEAEAKAKEIGSAIQNKEGVILKQSNPIAKTLSYPIKKRASGFFGFLEFQLEPEMLPELKGMIEKDSKIVRNMVTIKAPAMLRKERRTRGSFQTKSAEEYPVFEAKQKEEMEPIKKEKPAAAKEPGKEKVELKDIEQKLDELLSE